MQIYRTNHLKKRFYFQIIFEYFFYLTVFKICKYLKYKILIFELNFLLEVHFLDTFFNSNYSIRNQFLLYKKVLTLIIILCTTIFKLYRCETSDTFSNIIILFENPRHNFLVYNLRTNYLKFGFLTFIKPWHQFVLMI